MKLRLGCLGKSHLQPCPKIALLRWQNWPSTLPSSTAFAVQLCGYLPLGMLMHAIKELNIHSVLFHVNKLKKLTCSCQIEHFMFTAIKSFLIKVAYYQKLLKLGERKPVIQTCMSMEGMLPISQKSLGLILKSIFFKVFWSWFMLSVKLSIPNISIFIYRQSEYLKLLIKYY